MKMYTSTTTPVSGEETGEGTDLKGSAPDQSADNTTIPQRGTVCKGEWLDHVCSIRVTSPRPEHRARVRKTITCKDGAWSKMPPPAGKTHPKQFADALVKKTRSIKGLVKIIKDLQQLDEYRVILYGLPLPGLPAQFQRINDNFELPQGTRRLMIDADGWGVSEFYPEDKKDVARVVREYLAGFELDYLTRAPFVYNLSGGCLPDKDGVFRKLNCHLYFYLDAATNLKTLSNWALLVNRRCGHKKVIDEAGLRLVQADYFMPPLINEDSETGVFILKNRVGFVEGIDGTEWVLLEDLGIEAARVGKDLGSAVWATSEAISRAATSAGGTELKGITWQQTAGLFGNSGHCHTVEIGCCCQYVYEQGSEFFEEDGVMDAVALQIFNALWDGYKVREDRNEKADREIFTVSKVKKSLAGALGQGFGVIHDVCRDKVLTVAAAVTEGNSKTGKETMLTTDMVSTMDTVLRVNMWSSLQTRLLEKYSELRLKGQLDDALKRQCAQSVCDPAGEAKKLDKAKADGEYINKYNALISSGFKFKLADTGFLLVRCADEDHFINCNSVEFLRAANRAFIALDAHELQLTDRNADAVLSYAAARVETEDAGVIQAVRVYRDDAVTWLDSGVLDIVYKIEGGQVAVTTTEGSDCPCLFVRGRLAGGFPVVTQAEIDQEVKKLIDAYDRGMVTSDARLSEGGECMPLLREDLERWNLDDRGMKTIQAFIVFCLLGGMSEFIILSLIGEQGGEGKSLLGAFITWLTDPRYGQGQHKWNHDMVVEEFPANMESLALRMLGQYMCGANNLNGSESSQNKQLLHLLTVLVTGFSSTARRFHVQDDTVTFYGCNPLVMTGTRELVTVPDNFMELLKRIYPIHLDRYEGGRVDLQELLKDWDGERGKRRFCEILAACALVQREVGRGMGSTSRHRIPGFGDTLRVLEGGGGSTLEERWMKERFDKLEENILRNKYPWISGWINRTGKSELDILIDGGGDGETASTIADKSMRSITSKEVGRVLKNNQLKIERLYGVRLEHRRPYGEAGKKLNWHWRVLK